MNELKRVPPTSVSTLVIVLVTLGMGASSLQGAHRPQPPGYSAEQERERIAAAVRRMSEPDAQRERQLRDELGRVALQYRAGRNPSLREECEALFETILALPKPTATAYSLCAMTANILDCPQQAIDIVKKGIAEYPDEHIGGPIMPLRISGRYRIAAIATRIGDVNEAIQAYETILGSLDNVEGRQADEFWCHMYLAEIFSQMSGKGEAANKQLEQAVAVAEDLMAHAPREDQIICARLQKGWAAYELAKLRHRVTSRSLGPDPNALPSASACMMMAAMWAQISCPSLPEMELMAEADRPSILRTLARLGLATIYIEDSNVDPPKAEYYLRPVADAESYLKPYAKTMLALVYEDMREIREKMPALLKGLGEGDETQRDRAASRLVHECGSEGIKALQHAQDDPNKYVRYTAACALADQWHDYSAKPRFDIILDAFADQNPHVRRKAQSAVGLRSCLVVGPGETVTLIRLMNEHYSEELMRAVKELLFGARTKAQIMDVAIPELVLLTDHESADVLNGLLEIFARIGPPPAQAAPALAQRLDKIEDEAVQVRIIAVLGQIGPGAQEAVPVLARYARHKDPNIRNTALQALRRVSPATVDQLKPADRP